MAKIVISISLCVSLFSTGCSLLLDLGDVLLADGGVDGAPADSGVDSAPADSGVDSAPADSGVDSAPSARHYWCGYAMPGFHCDNGRSHVTVVALDMTSGVAMCRVAKPMSNLESCHVIDLDGAAPTDPTQCTAASGSWRPSNNCCNFEGTLSCP